MIRRRVLVSGLVQGVFFRDSCRQEAEARQVSGWVTNRDDGGVEAVFQGEPESVAAMIDWCRSGPDRAHVRDIAVKDETPTSGLSFEVR